MESNPPLLHLEALTALAKRLAHWDIQIYEFHYHNETFGSWTIFVGSGTKQLRVTWDGRDFRLDVARAARPSTEWSGLTFWELPVSQRGRRYEIVEELIKENFAVGYPKFQG